VPVSAGAGESSVIPFTIATDTLSEPVQDFAIRLSFDANTGSHTLANTEYSTTVADDVTDLADDGVDPVGSPYQLSGTVPPYALSGNGNANVFTAGETTAGIGNIGGLGGNDQYIITRYQTTHVNILDTVGNDVIRFDFGVSIASAATTGRGGANGVISLTDGNRITLNRPAQDRWSFQLGDGEQLSWADFLTAIDGGHTVSSYLDSSILVLVA